MRRFRAEVQAYAAMRRRLFEALARSRALVERSRRTIDTCEALMAEAAERLHARSSAHPRLHALGQREQV